MNILFILVYVSKQLSYFRFYVGDNISDETIKHKITRDQEGSTLTRVPIAATN